MPLRVRGVDLIYITGRRLPAIWKPMASEIYSALYRTYISRRLTKKIGRLHDLESWCFTLSMPDIQHHEMVGLIFNYWWQYDGVIHPSIHLSHKKTPVTGFLVLYLKLDRQTRSHC